MRLKWILDRLGERSTWIGIDGFLTAMGVILAPEQSEAIITAGVAVAGVIAAFTKDKLPPSAGAILIAAMILGPGCANIIAANLVGEGLVDGMVARAGVVADKVMDGLDVTEAVLERKLIRAKKARCLNTYPSIRRYALRSEKNRARIRRDCGLDVRPVSDVSVESPAAAGQGGAPPGMSPPDAPGG